MQAASLGNFFELLSCQNSAAKRHSLSFRWTEMIRASKTDPNLAATAAGSNGGGGQDKKGQKSIWKL